MKIKIHVEIEIIFFSDMGKTIQEVISIKIISTPTANIKQQK